jgi:hypothetical protein
MQPLDPLTVRGIALLVSPGHLRQLPRVHQQDFHPRRFQHLVGSDPVDPRALHGHRLHPAVFEPLPHADQLRRRRPEIGYFSDHSVRGGSAHPVPFAPQIHAGYVAANDRQPFDLSLPAWTILAMVVLHL